MKYMIGACSMCNVFIHLVSSFLLFILFHLHTIHQSKKAVAKQRIRFHLFFVTLIFEFDIKVYQEIARLQVALTMLKFLQR